MAINWGMAGGQDTGTNALAMFERGREMKREDTTRNALSAYAQNPNDQTLAPVLAADPRLGIQLRGQQQTQQANQRKQQQEQMLIMGKLLRNANDPQSYAQSRTAAQQYGLDISGVPEQFDPAWVGQQRLLVDAFNEDGGAKISGIARELVDAGYDIESPEGQAALRSVISNKYASEYVDDRGNTRRRSALNLEPAQGGPQPGVIEDGYRFKGGNPADPSAWEQVGQGGPTQPASGGFRP